jgi:hypothetical protein
VFSVYPWQPLQFPHGMFMHGLLHQQGIHGIHWHGGLVVVTSCGTVGATVVGGSVGGKVGTGGTVGSSQGLGSGIGFGNWTQKAFHIQGSSQRWFS